MAVALVIFARWSPLRCVAAALLRRRRRARPVAAVDRRDAGYYFFNQRLYPHPRHHDRDLSAKHSARDMPGELSMPNRERRMPTFAADPYPWPYNGDWRPKNTAIIVIDMQTDFCGKGGYAHAMGYDLSLTGARSTHRALLRRPAPRITTIIDTREGHRPDLADLPANKRWRSHGSGRDRRQGPCGDFWFAASRAGNHRGASGPSPANPSSTSRARDRSSPPI